MELLYEKSTGHKQQTSADRMSRRERTRLKQLLWSLGLVLSILLGKQIYPERMLEAGERILAVLGSNTAFDAAFEKLGESIRASGAPGDGLREFCVAVFGARDDAEVRQTAACALELPAAHAGLLSREIQPEELFAQLCVQTDDAAIPAVGTVLFAAAQEESLPEGCTQDKLSLGALDTVSPVVGKLNSGFGFRDHPVNGKYLFHGGADISAEAGDPIAAFADGTVEYLGEDSSYGLYLQLDHGNGVRSFYAHCQAVCVETGQRVAAGETIALVGSTGTATGPHLHLELKCCGMRVDPAYYIELLDA